MNLIILSWHALMIKIKILILFIVSKNTQTFLNLNIFQYFYWCNLVFTLYSKRLQTLIYDLFNLSIINILFIAIFSYYFFLPFSESDFIDLKLILELKTELTNFKKYKQSKKNLKKLPRNLCHKNEILKVDKKNIVVLCSIRRKNVRFWN